MDKFTIQQLQQMRESEDRVEFKAGEGGNVSYDGRGKTNPKDRRRCILGYVIALCNEGGGRLVIGMHDNYPHRVTGTRQAQDAIGQLESDIYRDTTIRPEIYELYDEEKRRVLVIEVPSRPIGKVFKFEDVPLMRVGEELKPMSDAMYLKILQESEPDFSEKICEGLSLEDLDEEAIRVMKQGYAQRYTDKVTLRKLINEGLLTPAQDGYKLSERYYEIAKNVGTVEDNRKDDTVNVQLIDTVKLSQLTERQRKIYDIIKSSAMNDTINDTINAQTLSDVLGASVITIKRDLYVLRDLNLIKYVGSNKTGHWEAVNQ
ncbi:MAG: putative DNA binding domain-containing protein [Mediterranea sp.]|nr:putative DNA binding domain-containing protein [Mediterranea sp.]